MRRDRRARRGAGRRGDCGRAAHPWPGRTAASTAEADHAHRHRPRTGAESAAAERGRDVEPARRAAIRAVAMTGEVVRAGFISRRELIESFTTPGFGPTLAASTSEAVTAMLLELGERDADVSDAGRAGAADHGHRRGDIRPGAQVRVWSVLVVAAPGVGPGRQVWRTVTLDMVERRRALAGGRLDVDAGSEPRPRRPKAPSTTPPRSWSRSAGRPHPTGDGGGGLSDVAVPEPVGPVR